MSELAAVDDSQRAEAVEDFARSALFDRTFRDGMALVEDAAAYLDGAGGRAPWPTPTSACA